MYESELLVQQNPGRYRQLAGELAPYQQQMQIQQPRQQQQQMPSMPMGMMDKFMGGGGGGAEGGGGLGSMASNPYVWLAAILAGKASDTKDRSGVSFERQAKNVSLAPQKDADRWQLEKIAPFGGKKIYQSTFDMATGDFSNWWKAHKDVAKNILKGDFS
jgi:hypothetical protein